MVSVLERYSNLSVKKRDIENDTIIYCIQMQEQLSV